MADLIAGEVVWRYVFFLGYNNFFVYEGFLLIPIDTMLQSYLGTLAKFLRAGMGPTDCR